MASAQKSKRAFVTVTSDFVCPWCFIGERRLSQAIKQVPEIEVQILWKPFQLNPWIQESGVARRDYRITKFGSWERSQSMDAQVAQSGRADGLAFNFERMQTTHNTFNLHRLMQLAEREGDTTRLAIRLFTAYFSEGADLADPDELSRVAVSGGLSVSRVDAVLQSDEFSREVRQLESDARIQGIDGVPLFNIGASMISGAQPASVLAAALRLMTAHDSEMNDGDHFRQPSRING